MKTRLRLDIDGPIVFLDSDTLPVRSLAGLVREDADFCAVTDPSDSKVLDRWYRPACHELKWGYPQVYLNSGVFYLSDSKTGYEIGKRWHDRWLQWSAFDKSELHSDQPSLNSSLTDIGARVGVLPPEFNMFTMGGMQELLGAKVFHYMASMGRMPRSSLLEHLRRHFDRYGEVDWSAVHKASATSNPWVYSRPVVFVETIANGLVRKLKRGLRLMLPRRFRSRLTR